jgi:hypothetical protein
MVSNSGQRAKMAVTVACEHARNRDACGRRKYPTDWGGAADGVEGIKAAGVERGPVAIAWERSQKLALGKLVRERTVASCGWLARG